MRGLRFYQNCSFPYSSSPPPPFPFPPPRPPPSFPGSPPPSLHPLPYSLPPCQLFAKLFPQKKRSGHYWTSTTRVWTHWAPLDLNLGPSELSEHRWTSTWDPPSSVSTAGPQPGILRAQWTPLDFNGQIECQKICQIKYQIECQKKCQKICQIKCQNICQIKFQKIY